jgi:hypothetical protein
MERTGMVTGDTIRVEPVDPVVVRRRRVRYFAAAMAACASLIYFLIGLRVVSVIQNPEEQVGFGLAAGAGFAIAALLTLSVDQRSLWVAGAVLQALIIFMYFTLAAERIPEFELWGILLRIVEVPLLVAVTYLAINPRKHASHAQVPAMRVGGTAS